MPEISDIRRVTADIGVDGAIAKLYEVVQVEWAAHSGRFFEPLDHGHIVPGLEPIDGRPIFYVTNSGSEPVEWNTTVGRRTDPRWDGKLPKAGDQVIYRNSRTVLRGSVL